MARVQIRDISSFDTENIDELKHRAFGPAAFADDHGTTRRDLWNSVNVNNCIGIYQDGGPLPDGRDPLLGFVAFNAVRQWWHGRDVPTAAFANVMMAPEARDLRATAPLLSAALERAAGQGLALAMVYPSVPDLYRGFGFEMSGAQHWYTFPVATLLSVARGPAVPMRLLTRNDQAYIADLLRHSHAAARDCGPIDWGNEQIGRKLYQVNEKPVDDTGGFYDIDDFIIPAHGQRAIGYLAEDGLLLYRWERSDRLRIDTLVAGSAATTRAFWRLIGSHAAIAQLARVCIGPDDPMHLLTHTGAPVVDRQRRWMLRVVDVAAALSGRGYPRLTTDLRFAVEDKQRAANAGTWSLHIEAGTGTVQRANDPAVPAPATAGPPQGAPGQGAQQAVGADDGAGQPGVPVFSTRGIAALYGGAPMRVLRFDGLVTGGDPGDDARFDAAFTADPFCLDHF